jgi:hypothetical protein
MDPKELKEIVADSANVEWLNNIDTTFNFPQINLSIPLKGITAIYEYVFLQTKYWQEVSWIGNPHLQGSRNYFASLTQSLGNFISNYAKTDTQTLSNNWTDIRNKIQDTSNFRFPYDTPEAAFLIQLYQSNRDYFYGGYLFLTKQHINYNDWNELNGMLLAFEFSQRNFSEITARRDPEKKSISRLKSEFQQYLSKSEQQLIEHLANANELYNDYAAKIDTLKVEKEKSFTEWFESTKTEQWNTWYDEKQETLKTLEETYETKLKLEKPAKYWEKKSTTYTRQAQKAKKYLIWAVGVSFCVITAIIFISPKWIFEQVLSGNVISAIRWSVLFLTLISLIAFSLRIISKYMMSSYHLARDAEERHTLTFFYLALLKDTEVKDEDRKLILQSLFSRSDTGLLKEDSSPTMPNDLISKITNSIK